MKTWKNEKEHKFRQKQLLRQRLRLAVVGIGVAAVAAVASTGIFFFKSTDSSAQKETVISTSALPVEMNVTQLRRDTSATASYRTVRPLDGRPYQPAAH